MDETPAPEVPVLSRPGWWSRRNRHAVFLCIITGLLLVNFATAVIVPFAQHALVRAPAWNAENKETGCVSDPPRSYCVEPITNRQRWDHLLDDYWMSLGMSLAGAYLVFPPVWFAFASKLIWFPWQPFVWVAAVGSVPLVWRYGRRVNVVARFVYAMLIMLLASGFLWYYWPSLPS